MPYFRFAACLGIVFAMAGTSMAIPIVNYNFTGYSAPPEVSGIVGSVAPNLGASDLARGPGLIANDGSNCLNSKDWDLSALNADDYYGFTLEPLPWYSDLKTELWTISFSDKRSTYGPQYMSLRSSLDSFGSDIAAWSCLDTLQQTRQFSLDGIPITDEPVTFRIYAWGAATEGGTYRLADYDAGNGIGLQIDGEVIPMPEPVTLSLLALALPLLRRKK